MSVLTGSRRRNRLLNRINQRYQTCEEVLEIGALKLHFTRIADPDRVLDDAAAAEENPAPGSIIPSVPYWAELWDSALGLANWLAVGASTPMPPPANLAQLQVLDLGCGMGLAGACAAALGAYVTFADFQTLPLLFARLNSLPWSRRVEARRVDWRSDVMGRKFDLILGADIVYEQSAWEHLERFWNAHLVAGGAVVLGEPGRQTGDGFISWIRDLGWSLEQAHQGTGINAKPVRILQVRRQ